MLKTQAEQQEWLRTLSHTTGKSVSQIAVDAGIASSTLTRFMRKRNDDLLKPATIKKIEKEFGGADGSVLTPVHNLSTVDVIGVVEAGSWREAQSGHKPMYSVSIPPNVAPGVATYGLEIRGQSMNKRYPHGTVVIVVKAIETGREPREDERVIVERTRNGLVEATCKVYRGGKLWPDSDHPDHQKPLEIAPESDLGHEEVRITGYVVGSYRPE